MHRFFIKEDTAKKHMNHHHLQLPVKNNQLLKLKTIKSQKNIFVLKEDCVDWYQFLHFSISSKCCVNILMSLIQYIKIYQREYIKPRWFPNKTQSCYKCKINISPFVTSEICISNYCIKHNSKQNMCSFREMNKFLTLITRSELRVLKCIK